ncbi:flavin reductase family protein [Pseudomaricurvus alkylphenolicus]|uniref:flavin reductase family protein n=1 Tax=Pseudomaricurvus alkylphenolicus TaxID=1306991 RepID=UPI00141D91E7|nr:flavin reductase family protein [Pseudomaricurvus alkylphenolicus]NIB40512.1 flavin reductase family protein [Pseudomaricurvus alkylphenolicus]
MSIDTRSLRDALGKFATGVCVITSEIADASPIGMTINSFASLSLDPPLVIWSIAKTSDCFNHFESTERYAVNILKEDQQALSGRYSRRGDHNLKEGDWTRGNTDCPVLRESLACFECEIFERLDGGDHVILVGRVLEANHEADEKPLLFFAGQYRSIAD